MNNGVDGSYKIRDKLNVKKWILSFFGSVYDILILMQIYKYDQKFTCM